MPLYITSANPAPVSVEGLLAGRDKRRARQQAWLTRYGLPLVSFTVLAPGAVKDSALTRRIFNRGLRALRARLAEAGWTIRQQRCAAPATGAEGLLAVDAPARELKRAVIALEEASPLGRLWDFDVLTPQGEMLSRRDFGLPARSCLICQRDAAVCARERAHSLAELLRLMAARLDSADEMVTR